jgi:AraC family transcriptional regulator
LIATTEHVEQIGARAQSACDRSTAVDKVIAAMRDRLDAPFALDEMAAIAYLSPFYFNRVFRQVTGVPPGRFHTALRMAAAKRLLLTTDQSVTEICLDVGYQSLGTFTTHFRELVGVSPRELRRLAQDPPLRPSQVLAALESLAHASGNGNGNGDGNGNGNGNGHPAAVRGMISCAEPVDDRLVFVGLFRHAYPQGLPAGCTVRSGAGPFALHAGTGGRGHVAAAAFPRSEDLSSRLLGDCGSLLVASSPTPVAADRGVSALRNLRLRRPRATDPPILLALPLIAALRLTERQSNGREVGHPAPC